MYQNKNIIIAVLSILLLLLSIYAIVLTNKEIPTPEPIVKTITKEEIVYITKPQNIETVKPKKELVKEEVLKKPIMKDLPEVEVPLTEDKEFIITSTRDKNGRFSISLLSASKPPKEAFYDRKIILHAQIEEGEYIGNFLFLVPPSSLENIDDLKIKITDALSGKSYLETAYCLAGIEPKYNYSMNISLSGGFNCYTQENGEAFKIPEQSDEAIKRMQDIFEKAKMKQSF